MWNCNSLIWLAFIVAIVGIALLLKHYFRPAEEQTDSAINIKTAGLGFIVLAIPLAITGSYMKCSFKVSACPTAIGGNGYVCTNEGSGCFGITPGKCKTVAGTLPWDSSCECKCK